MLSTCAALHAQEAHQRNMPLAIAQALDQAGVTIADLDGVGFTRGPGTLACLWDIVNGT